MKRLIAGVFAALLFSASPAFAQVTDESDNAAIAVALAEIAGVETSAN